MTLEVLTPQNPRWGLFVRLLEHALDDGGCGGDSGDSKHLYAEAVMAELGGGIDIARTLEFFEQHGGYCDCEILLNVER